MNGEKDKLSRAFLLALYSGALAIGVPQLVGTIWAPIFAAFAVGFAIAAAITWTRERARRQ